MLISKRILAAPLGALAVLLGGVIFVFLPQQRVEDMFYCPGDQTAVWSAAFKATGPLVCSKDGPESCFCTTTRERALVSLQCNRTGCHVLRVDP